MNEPPRILSYVTPATLPTAPRRRSGLVERLLDWLLAFVAVLLMISMVIVGAAAVHEFSIHPVRWFWGAGWSMLEIGLLVGLVVCGRTSNRLGQAHDGRSRRHARMLPPASIVGWHEPSTAPRILGYHEPSTPPAPDAWTWERRLAENLLHLFLTLIAVLAIVAFAIFSMLAGMELVAENRHWGAALLWIGLALATLAVLVSMTLPWRRLLGRSAQAAGEER